MLLAFGVFAGIPNLKLDTDGRVFMAADNPDKIRLDRFEQEFAKDDNLAIIIVPADGEVFTPIPNGTFLAGITRARHMSNMRADGIKVHETVLSFDDFHAADEVFLSGNMMKVTPVKAFDDTQYQIGPMTRRVREMYCCLLYTSPSPRDS